MMRLHACDVALAWSAVLRLRTPGSPTSSMRASCRRVRRAAHRPHPRRRRRARCRRRGGWKGECRRRRRARRAGVIEGDNFGRLPTVSIGGRATTIVARTDGGGIVARVPDRRGRRRRGGRVSQPKGRDAAAPSRCAASPWSCTPASSSSSSVDKERRAARRRAARRAGRARGAHLRRRRGGLRRSPAAPTAISSW